MVAVFGDEFPVHAAIFGNINTRCAAGEEFFFIEINNTGTITVRRGLGNGEFYFLAEIAQHAIV